METYELSRASHIPRRIEEKGRWQTEKLGEGVKVEEGGKGEKENVSCRDVCWS